MHDAHIYKLTVNIFGIENGRECYILWNKSLFKLELHPIWCHVSRPFFHLTPTTIHKTTRYIDQSTKKDGMIYLYMHNNS
jgi:hypothetical protein